MFMKSCFNANWKIFDAYENFDVDEIFWHRWKYLMQVKIFDATENLMQMKFFDAYENIMVCVWCNEICYTHITQSNHHTYKKIYHTWVTYQTYY